MVKEQKKRKIKCSSHPSIKQGSENSSLFHETSDYCGATTGLINITGFVMQCSLVSWSVKLL